MSVYMTETEFEKYQKENGIRIRFDERGKVIERVWTWDYAIPECLLDLVLSYVLEPYLTHEVAAVPVNFKCEFRGYLESMGIRIDLSRESIGIDNMDANLLDYLHIPQELFIYKGNPEAEIVHGMKVTHVGELDIRKRRHDYRHDQYRHEVLTALILDAPDEEYPLNLTLKHTETSLKTHNDRVRRNNRSALSVYTRFVSGKAIRAEFIPYLEDPPARLDLYCDHPNYLGWAEFPSVKREEYWEEIVDWDALEKKGYRRHRLRYDECEDEWPNWVTEPTSCSEPDMFSETNARFLRARTRDLSALRDNRRKRRTGKYRHKKQLSSRRPRGSGKRF